MEKNISESLKKPFSGDRISWRVGQAFINGPRPFAKLLAYIDARDVMDRLDEVFGIEGWSDTYIQTPKGWLCSLSCKVGNLWLIKTDGAEETAVEAQKGGLSDAFKRAAVKWGIGRFLYDMGETMVPLTTEKPKSGDYGFHSHKEDNGKRVYYYYILPEVIVDANGKVSVRRQP